jgi:hypothetical protein
MIVARAHPRAKPVDSYQLQGEKVMLKAFASILGLCLPTLSAIAQPPVHVPFADSSAARILAHTSNPRDLRNILRQVGRPQPQSKLDELADTLTERALSHADKGAFDEIRALEDAGERPQRNDTGAPSVPYEGSLSRLIRIHREAPPSAEIARGTALRALNAVVGFDSTVKYLRFVATSHDRTAHIAMAELISDADPNYPGTLSVREQQQTLSMLRRLWDQVADSVPMLPGPSETVGKAAVPTFAAYANLAAFARVQGWTK